ncbi:hypothetical protein LBE40_00150 [Bartonella taylorii]|uniref:Uncharacterized protein n=1 Tax=Bartonella taylorii 8TBB TaxID=1094560 RepID=A0A9P2W3K0_BARTA|nr:hypothetical protein [Bartonella taylorii]EJF97799.1 hypothetical protein ME9_00065 [Bartonella taylorii 8TBB]USP01299.1 hypothetical protein LBE40_00150 [Bartonella taylorii]
MQGKNSTLDKEPRFFSFEEAFLTAKNYRVLFYISVIIVLFRIAIFVPFFLSWEPTEWQKTILSGVYILQEVIGLCILAFIPVMLVLRIILGYLLEKNIQKLEEAICKRNKTTRLRDELSKESWGKNGH